MDPNAILGSVIRDVPDFPKPGILFKDITPIFQRSDLIEVAVQALADPFRDAGITQVLGVEARGFILGGLLAQTFGAGFVPVRKKGKLPYKTMSEEYALEYGTDTIEIHVDALTAADRVLIHDDLIATGGTAAATGRLVAHSGATLVGYTFLVELGFLNGRGLLDDRVVCHTVLQF